MEIGKKSLTLGARTTIAGAPDGVDGQVLAAIARESCASPGGPNEDQPIALLHIARDAERLRTLVQGLGFFAPDVELVTVPAWDCLPYDRVSPNAAISSERIDALSRLAGLSRRPGRPRILATTVNAILQRVPARDAVGAAAFRAEVGGRVDLTSLTDYLVQNGYLRSGTVREAGEFAVRGGIIDIFPPGADQPVRLDLFGEELEGLRSFDPLTQISSGKVESLALLPVGEVILDAAAIARFRDGYRAAFGAVAGPDPLVRGRGPIAAPGIPRTPGHRDLANQAEKGAQPAHRRLRVGPGTDCRCGRRTRNQGIFQVLRIGPKPEPIFVTRISAKGIRLTEIVSDLHISSIRLSKG